MVLSEEDAWKRQPLRWDFEVSVGGIDLGSAAMSPGDMHSALQASLIEWLGDTKEESTLSLAGNPERGAATDDWSFHFEMSHKVPSEALPNLRVDAISLLCLNKDTGMCKDGRKLFQPILARYCSGRGLEGCVKEMPTLRVNLKVPEWLFFTAAFAPLPQQLVDDVTRVSEMTMEEWALKLTPRLQEIVAQTANIAEDLVRVRSPRVEKVPAEEGKMPALALTADLEVGLLASSSRSPVRESMLAGLSCNHAWVMDKLGLAAEEHHIGDIGLVVKAVNTTVMDQPIDA